MIEYTTQAIHRLATYAGNTYDQHGLFPEQLRLTFLFMDVTRAFLFFVACPAFAIGMVCTSYAWSCAVLCLASFLGARYITNYPVDQMRLRYPNHLIGYQRLSLLHMADSVARVRELAAAGADFNLRGGFGVGVTPLFYACFSADRPLPIIQALIEGGADVEGEDPSLLYLCLENPLGVRRYDVFNDLLARGANPNQAVKGKPLLYWALRFNAPPEVIQNLARHGAEANGQAGGKPLLYWALLWERPAAAVEVLVRAGAAPEARVGPLSLAELARRWKAPHEVLALLGTENHPPRAYRPDRDVMGSLSLRGKTDLEKCGIFDDDEHPQSLFWRAVSDYRCSKETILEIIQKGADINKMGVDPTIPLEKMFERFFYVPGNGALFQALEGAGADFNPPCDGHSLLYRVVNSWSNNSLCFRYLIEQGAKLKGSEFTDHHFLNKAISKCSVEIFNDVVFSHTLINDISYHCYFHVKSREMAQFLYDLDPRGFDMHQTGRNCFIEALRQQTTPEVIDWFLGVGMPSPPTNCSHTHRGTTICHSITTKEQFDKLIERLGADSPLWQLEDEEGRLPIHCIYHPLVVKALVERGINSADARDRAGRAHLHFPAIGMELAQVLLEGGADVNARDRHGETPLSTRLQHITSHWNQLSLCDLKTLSYLLMHKADPTPIRATIGKLNDWWESLALEAQKALLAEMKAARERSDYAPLSPDVCKGLLLEIFAYFSLLPGQVVSRRRAVAMAKWYAGQEGENI